MTLPYVITILVTSGDPDGVRVVEKSNWTGQGVVFSRADLGAAAQWISSPGAYVLLGDDPLEEYEGQIYIGEGEDVAKRVAQHQSDDTKEFWRSTVAFTSKDSALNKAHIRYLESRLIDLAHEARRARLTNGTRPAIPPMSAADCAEAEGFLAEVLAIFPVLGVDAFSRPATQEPGRIRYYLSSTEAQGSGEERSDGFLVFAGAKARIKESNSISDANRRFRSRLLKSGVLAEDGVGSYRLTVDHLFRSPSTAAMTLLGRNSNGRVEWKDEQGVTLKQHQEEAAQQASGILNA